ncbi:hypothetical protein EVAR_79428_1 [Eumeta japonica]|uniref:Uncharacterized protein n=1 Tax=Eumeta variegata TaxID=151549 RepID=A0A4C1VHT5_EUMVA|nr:hypothetical protein EVAR_79428_1 [Eumeta japonica]
MGPPTDGEFSAKYVVCVWRGRPRVHAVMVMERLADFVSKSLEGGEAPAPPPEPGEPAPEPDDDLDVEVDITALEDKPPPPPPAKRPRNWLLSPPALPLGACKREPHNDDDDEHKHGDYDIHLTILNAKSRL